MKEDRPFYIGWQDEMTISQSSFLKKALIPLFIAIPLIAFLIVWAQKPFSEHVFEIGKITEHTGVYHSDPVPMLEVSSKSLPKDISNYVLLVGYGKFGAEGIINAIEKNSGSLNKRKITLQGSLCHGDGKAVLELTKKENSLIEISEVTEMSESHVNKTKPKLAFEKSGEILDPKCYFGVMKPGEGKIHKSCAIRCISGGIPPVFRVRQGPNSSVYHLLLGLNGEKINKDILDKIGEDVLIKGSTSIINGWNVLYADPSKIR